MLKKYDYFLFDWDGCLARTLEVWLDAYKQVFAEYNIYPNDKEITERVFGNWDGPKKLGITDNDIKTYIKKLLEIVNKNITTVPLYPNAKETIESLHQHNKKLAILTTSTRKLIEAPLKYHKLTHLFDVILTTDDVIKDKPNPEMVDIALKKLGGTKEKTLIIGDSKKDLMLAQNANVKSALFYPKKHNLFYNLEKLKSHNPTYIIEELNELISTK